MEILVRRFNRNFDTSNICYKIRKTAMVEKLEEIQIREFFVVKIHYGRRMTTSLLKIFWTEVLTTSVQNDFGRSFSKSKHISSP